MSVWSLLIVDGIDVVAQAFHESKDGFRGLPVFLKHVPSLMVGEHGGHCFLVGASGLSQVLSVRIGPAFSCNPVFRFNKDRTDFPEPSRRCIAAHRSRLNSFCCSETSAPVASSARQGMSWAVLNRSFADEPNSGIGLSAFEHGSSQNERTSFFP